MAVQILLNHWGSGESISHCENIYFRDLYDFVATGLYNYFHHNLTALTLWIEHDKTKLILEAHVMLSFM